MFSLNGQFLTHPEIFSLPVFCRLLIKINALHLFSTFCEGVCKVQKRCFCNFKLLKFEMTELGFTKAFCESLEGNRRILNAAFVKVFNSCEIYA